MEISISKSKIISLEDNIIILEVNGSVELNIGKVSSHKYLGIDTFGTIFKTKQNWERSTMRMANTYMWACKKLLIQDQV